MCSELTPRARIPETRIPQLMQPCCSKRPIEEIDFSTCLGRMTREKDTALSLQKSIPGMEFRLQRVGTSPILVDSTMRSQKDQNKTHVCSQVLFAQKNEFLKVQVNLKGIKQGLWIDSNDSIPVSFVH